MAIDFPASPTNGQTFVVGTVTYTWDGVKWTAVAAGGGGGGGSGDKIEEGNTSAEVIDTGTDGRFVVTTEGTERARIDSSGRLLVGTSSVVNPFGSRFTVAGTGAGRTLNFAAFENDVDGALVYLSKSRSSTVGTNTIVQNGDTLGRFAFYGADGSSYVNGGGITCSVDGAPGVNDMPTRLTFSTTADGASAPTERMRIGQNGRTSVFCDDDIFYASTAAGGGTSVALYYGFYGATGVNTGSVAYRVWSNGDVQNANNSYGGFSDIKLKENIVDANSQWNDIKALQVRKYNFKEGQTHTQIGLIAQEAEVVSPGLVSESPDRDADGNDLGTVTKSVNYSVLYMKAVKALQEAMERIETLEAKVAALEGASSHHN